VPQGVSKQIGPVQPNAIGTPCRFVAGKESSLHVARAEKGTQGREMKRKIRIATALALAGFLSVSAPMAVNANPLLSGYGGPGAGEQTIVGSAHLGGSSGGGGAGAHGGAATGGSSGSSGRTPSSSGGALSGGGGSTFATGGSTSTGTQSSHARSGGKPTARSGAGSGGILHAGRASRSAFVYPSSLRSVSASSSALGMSGGSLVLLIGAVAALALVGTLTIRLARLQP
jgi:hypothetical protein